MRLAAFIGTLVVCAVAAPAAQACTITWDGQLGDRWFEMQPNGPGAGDDVYNWSPERYPTLTDDACFPSGAVASTRQVTQNTPDVRSLTISAGATLTVDNVQMIVRENSVNDGTLNMAGPVPMTVSDGDPADHEALTNNGTLNFPALTGNGLQVIAGGLTNNGTINVDDPDASIQRGAAGSPDKGNHANQGTINISAGNSLRILSSNFVNGPSGVITGAGTMNMAESRFEAGSGSQIVAPDRREHDHRRVRRRGGFDRDRQPRHLRCLQRRRSERARGNGAGRHHSRRGASGHAAITA